MSAFLCSNPFGMVPVPSPGPDYPRGYGVPNPVPIAHDVGDGTLFQCGRAFPDVDFLIQNIWRSFRRDFYAKGSVSTIDQDNFNGSGGPVPFESDILIVPAENPSPTLPRPSSDILTGPVFQAPPPGVRDAYAGARFIIAGGLNIGAFQEAISLSGGPSVANLPVYLDVYAQLVFDFYQWFRDGPEGRSYYCNFDLVVEAEARWAPDYTADPMPILTFYPWYTRIAGIDPINLRSVTYGKLWSSGAPGSTASVPGSTIELAAFPLGELAPASEPYVNAISWEEVAMFTASHYYPRPAL